MRNLPTSSMLVLGQKLGTPENPYLQRWVFQTPLFSVRLHHWFYGDDPRAFHDHGWNFICLVLKGSYTDISPEGEELMPTGTVRFRKAEHKHTVKTEGCWTLVLTGKTIRKWGFWVKNKSGSPIWLKAKRYFLKYGHHTKICEGG